MQPPSIAKLEEIAVYMKYRTDPQYRYLRHVPSGDYYINIEDRTCAVPGAEDPTTEWFYAKIWVLPLSKNNQEIVIAGPKTRFMNGMFTAFVHDLSPVSDYDVTMVILGETTNG